MRVTIGVFATCGAGELREQENRSGSASVLSRQDRTTTAPTLNGLIIPAARVGNAASASSVAALIKLTPLQNYRLCLSKDRANAPAVESLPRCATDGGATCGSAWRCAVYKTAVS